MAASAERQVEVRNAVIDFFLGICLQRNRMSTIGKGTSSLVPLRREGPSASAAGVRSFCKRTFRRRIEEFDESVASLSAKAANHLQSLRHERNSCPSRIVFDRESFQRSCAKSASTLRPYRHG